MNAVIVPLYYLQYKLRVFLNKLRCMKILEYMNKKKECERLQNQEWHFLNLPEKR